MRRAGVVIAVVLAGIAAAVLWLRAPKSTPGRVVSSGHAPLGAAKLARSSASWGWFGRSDMSARTVAGTVRFKGAGVGGATVTLASVPSEAGAFPAPMVTT